MLFISNNHNLTNRLRLLLSGKYIDATALLWYRNKIFNSATYWSSGLTVGYRRIKVSPNTRLIVGLTGLRILTESEDTESFPKKSAIMVSIGCLIVK